MDFKKSCDFMYSQMNNLSNDQKLVMYALFKQASVGDAPIDSPSKMMLLDFSKWNAWNKVRGIKSVDAKNEYIKIANDVYKNLIN